MVTVGDIRPGIRLAVWWLVSWRLTQLVVDKQAETDVTVLLICPKHKNGISKDCRRRAQAVAVTGYDQSQISYDERGQVGIFVRPQADIVSHGVPTCAVSLNPRRATE